MPATVYDRSSGQPVSGDPNELAAGIAEGRYAFDAADTVSLRSDDGIVQLPAAEASEAVAKGTHSLITPQEEAADQIQREEAGKGIGASLGAGAQSFANQALLGVPEAIQQHTETPEEAAHREAVNQAHPVARAIGGVAGFGASLLTGGALLRGLGLGARAAAGLALPAEQAATRALTGRLVAQGAKLATEGAALAAPQALVHAAFGDERTAAETLAWGAGAGAVLGVTGELLSSGASAAGKAISGAAEEGLEKAHLDLTPKAIGAQKSQVQKISTKLRDEISGYAHEQGLLQPGMAKEDVRAAILKKWEQQSHGVHDTLRALDDSIANASDETRPAVLDAHLTREKVASGIEELLKPWEMQQRSASAQRRALENIAADARDLPTTMVDGREIVPFDVAQKFKQSLYSKFIKSNQKVENADAIKGVSTITAEDVAKNDAYNAVRNVIAKASNDVGLASENPDLIGKLSKHNKELVYLHRLREWSGNAEAQAVGNKGIGLTDWLAGGIAHTAGSAIGGPVGGAAAAIGSYFLKHWAQDKGLIYLSAAAHRAARSGDADLFAAVLGADAKQRLAATMSSVGDTIKTMARSGIQASAPRKNEHLKMLLGDTTGLSSAQQQAKLEHRVTSLASNPQALAAATSAVVGPLAIAAPQIAQSTQAKLAEQIHYLAASIPRPAAPPGPFAPNTWQASPAQKLAFRDRAEIVASPAAALQHMASGTLSDAHIDALKANYPVIYAAMRHQVIEFAAEHPGTLLPAAERISIAKFLGAPIGVLSSPQSVRSLQDAYAGQGPTAPKNPKMSGSKLKNAPSQQTTFGATTGPTQTEER
jgi:hypothetical protein